MARLADPDLALRRRRQILDAALVCFRRRGFHQATVQEICAEAGISAGALYRYFPSKADIIAAIAEDNRRETEALLDDVKRGASLIEALTIVSRKFFEKFDEAGDGPLICDVLAEAGRDPLLSQRLAEIDHASRQRLAAAIEAAQTRGEIDPALDPDLAAETLFAMIEGLGIRHAISKRISSVALTDRFKSVAKRYLAATP
ncbi:MAG: TetR family transcriptional regulator [Alphaproteobacteria bacterium]|nr:TetR family transcriptional regulator [Alphaproteobacteria bacterium]